MNGIPSNPDARTLVSSAPSAPIFRLNKLWPNACAARSLPSREKYVPLIPCVWSITTVALPGASSRRTCSFPFPNAVKNSRFPCGSQLGPSKNRSSAKTTVNTAPGATVDGVGDEFWNHILEFADPTNKVTAHQITTRYLTKRIIVFLTNVSLGCEGRGDYEGTAADDKELSLMCYPHDILPPPVVSFINREGVSYEGRRYDDQRRRVLHTRNQFGGGRNANVGSGMRRVISGR